MDNKIYNMEACLQNNGYLLFYFSSFFSRLTKLMILLFGLANLVCGILILFFEEKRKRNMFLQVLFLLQMLNAWVLHFPFVEHLDNRGREMKHFMLSIMIAFSLVMLAGYRTTH